MDKEYKTSGYTFVGANNAAGFPTATLGREGTLTAFYGNPRQVVLDGDGQVLIFTLSPFGSRLSRTLAQRFSTSSN